MFLFCLPLRLGVLVASFLQLVVSAAASGLVIAVLVIASQDHNAVVPTRIKIILIVVATVTGLTSLNALIGFIGAIRKSKSQVRAFSSFMRFLFVIQVAIVTAYLIFFFVDKKELNNLCLLDGQNNDNRVELCAKLGKIPLWTTLVVAIVALILQAYGIYIVSSYVHKLAQVDSDRDFLRGNSFGYKEESHPLTQGQAYPYADNAHSFGRNHV
ncbi:hypothetical protein FB45DRAFT_893906 [Roridomyces roridus]|uniref:Uncharacterized protein n=1 Tax=Roridomyces roridus TaxID=1738132 RepID=A0AAD7FWW8_9AGAR|nr:hypothetical protein FB45DRAFT_893906 [Roridomyces roridus]